MVPLLLARVLLRIGAGIDSPPFGELLTDVPADGRMTTAILPGREAARQVVEKPVVQSFKSAECDVLRRGARVAHGLIPDKGTQRILELRSEATIYYQGVAGDEASVV